MKPYPKQLLEWPQELPGLSCRVLPLYSAIMLWTATTCRLEMRRLTKVKLQYIVHLFIYILSQHTFQKNEKRRADIHEILKNIHWNDVTTNGNLESTTISIKEIQSIQKPSSCRHLHHVALQQSPTSISKTIHSAHHHHLQLLRLILLIYAKAIMKMRWNNTLIGMLDVHLKIPRTFLLHMKLLKSNSFSFNSSHPSQWERGRRWAFH